MPKPHTDTPNLSLGGWDLGMSIFKGSPRGAGPPLGHLSIEHSGASINTSLRSSGRGDSRSRKKAGAPERGPSSCRCPVTRSLDGRASVSGVGMAFRRTPARHFSVL